MRARLSLRAEHDLGAIIDYLQERSPSGARSVAAAIKKTIDMIELFPDAGRYSGEEDTRVLPAGQYPYLIYWATDRDGVVIVHIRHGARRPIERP